MAKLWKHLMRGGGIGFFLGNLYGALNGSLACQVLLLLGASMALTGHILIHRKVPREVPKGLSKDYDVPQVEPMFLTHTPKEHDDDYGKYVSQNHDYFRYTSKEGGWVISICPCGKVRIHASPVDDVIERMMTSEKAQMLLKMNSFAVQWHLRGYDEIANRLKLPDDHVELGFHMPEVEKLNAKMHHRYFLYEKEVFKS